MYIVHCHYKPCTKGGGEGGGDRLNSSVLFSYLLSDLPAAAAAAIFDFPLLRNSLKSSEGKTFLIAAIVAASTL